MKESAVKARGWTSGFWSTVVGLGLISPAGISLAGHPLERQAECIENKTDDLEDLIDDDFDRSPDYRFLNATAERLDQWAEDLDEAVEDGELGCAIGLASRIAAQAHQLGGWIGRQPPCHVDPRAVGRGIELVSQIEMEAGGLSVALQGGNQPSLGLISPSPNPYPVYRPSWPVRDPRFDRDPRFNQGWPGFRSLSEEPSPFGSPWEQPRWNGSEIQGDDWERLPVEEIHQSPSANRNPQGARPPLGRRLGAHLPGRP
jgi:hypothetical protein